MCAHAHLRASGEDQDAARVPEALRTFAAEPRTRIAISASDLEVQVKRLSSALCRSAI